MAIENASKVTESSQQQHSPKHRFVAPDSIALSCGRFYGYEELLSLIPYRRGTSPGIDLAYATKFHLQLLRSYAEQYPSIEKEFEDSEIFEKEQYVIGGLSRNLIHTIDVALQVFEIDPSFELIAALWGDVIKCFRDMHQWKDNSVWPEFERDFEDWKQGKFGMA